MSLVKKEVKKISEYNPDYFKNIARRSNILSCIGCGTCTSSCESGRWTALKTRIIVRKVALGDMSVLSDPDIWLCTTCYNCYERCPRDVRPTDVIIELRNYASREGFMSASHTAVVGYLRGTGHAVPINQQIIERREALGLDPIPPTLYKYREDEDTKHEFQVLKEKFFQVADKHLEKSEEKK